MSDFDELEKPKRITRDDVKAGGWDAAHLDGSDRKGRWYRNEYRSRAYPRLCKVESNRQDPPTLFYVDGWPHLTVDAAMEALNRPPRNPPPPPKTPREELEDEVQRALQDPGLMTPKAIAAELAEENLKRWSVFTNRIKEGMSAKRYGKRLAITLRLEELAKQAKDPTDLFGGL